MCERWGIIDRRDRDGQRLGGSRDRCATCCSIIGQRYRQNGRAIRIAAGVKMSWPVESIDG